ncbi:MAG: hypothetical protein R3B93_02080 [Bacteroidia bacterium]
MTRYSQEFLFIQIHLMTNVLVELQLDQTDDIRLEVVNLQGKLIYSLEK